MKGLFEDVEINPELTGSTSPPLLAEPILDFVLYDLKRGVYVHWQPLTTTEAVEWTKRLAKSFCPNLQWQKSGAADQAVKLEKAQKKSDNTSPEPLPTARAYVIRRN